MTETRDSRTPITRRQLLKVTAIAVGATALPLLIACQQAAPTPTLEPTKAPTQAPTKAPEATKPPAPAATQAPAATATTPPKPTTPPVTPTPSGLKNSVGTVLPADAAPLDKQVFRFLGTEGKHFDASKNIYESNGMQTYMFDHLVYLDYDGNVFPGAAESWKVDADRVTWTFNMRKGAKWSDGAPCTAKDFEFGWRRMLDQKTANPYGWFYYGIKNAKDVHTGKKPLEELGVKALDDYTLQIVTEQPLPYLLLVVGFLMTGVPKHIVEKMGNDWATDVQTTLSSGPFYPAEWNRGREVIWKPNPHYNGPNKPMLEKVQYIINPGVPGLQVYQANEIDWLGVGFQDIKASQANDTLKKDLDVYANFVTYYMFWNDTKPPFNDKRVRQAISHCIDRDTIANKVMGGLEMPGFTHLPPGFPCSQADKPEIRKIQEFNPTLAKQLFAEAGFPNGKGFPEGMEIWCRETIGMTEAEAIQNTLKSILNIEVKPRSWERALYMEKLGKYEVPWGFIQWAMDYVDPANFMDWWATQSRHTFKNEKYNELNKAAGQELDWDKRCKLYNEAEKILIEEVAGAFVGHPVVGVLWKPQIAGLRRSKKNGARPHYLKMYTDIYVKKV